MWNNHCHRVKTRWQLINIITIFILCPKTQSPSVSHSWLMSWIFWWWETLEVSMPWIALCLRIVLVHPSFIPINDLLQEILAMINKAEGMSEGWVRDARHSNSRTTNVAYFQRKIQLSGFSGYPDCLLTNLIRISGIVPHQEKSCA